MKLEAESSKQVASRQRLEYAITAGIAAESVLRLVLSDPFGIAHLVSGLGGDMNTAGRTSFARFCASVNRFDVFKAVFESSEVAWRLTPLMPIDTLLSRTEKTLTNGVEAIEQLALGSSLMQVGIRQLCPELVEYALVHADKAYRYPPPEGDAYQAAFLALSIALGNDDTLDKAGAEQALLECSRLLLLHRPTRGQNKDSLAPILLSSMNPGHGLREVAHQIILDHLNAGLIDPSYHNGKSGETPYPLLHSAICSEHVPLATALVEKNFMDPALEDWLQAAEWSNPSRSSIALECVTLQRVLRMRHEITSSSAAALHQISDMEPANPPQRRRLRLI